MHETRSAYRRTKRTALAVASAALAVALATEPGAAAPAGATPFNNGTGSATAVGYKVNPVMGNLSFGVTVGESLSGHQNTAATAQSRSINTGVVGLTLAAEGCDGGDPTWSAEDQPQPVIARSGEEGAAEGKTETEPPGGMEKFARATTDPYAEAITTIAPMGDPAALFINGGRTITHSGVLNGTTREALARTELGTVSIGGQAIRLEGLVWEAIHRSGAVNETLGTFTMGSVVIGGEAHQLPGDGFEQAAALNDLLAPLGLEVTPPAVRNEQGIVFVDPLKIGIIPSQERDAVLGGVISEGQPLRAAITEALLEADCGFAALITVADVVIGSFTGAGALGLELGGVQAMTADFTQFKFGSLPDLAALPPLSSVGSTFAAGTPAGGPAVAAPPAAQPAATTAAETERVSTQPIAGFTGERGGLMALVGGGGLLLLLATAEADRRKMRQALREIPLET